MSKMEKSNEIEHPDEVAEGLPGEKVAVTNPIVVYSDVPGAGPDNPNAPAEPEKDKDAKAVKSPPSDKAVKPKEDK